MIKIDFHTHTCHSFDSLMKPERILTIAHLRGLTAIVINDHNTIKGGLEACVINPYPDLEVIVGAEIRTDAGDVTGIYLQKEIESCKFKDVAHEIKDQGGLVILNHPFVGHNLDLIDFDLVDLVEGYNSRLSLKQNQMAIQLAQKKNIPFVSGSDAHVYSEIGKCTTQYNDKNLLLPVDNTFTRTGYLSIPVSQFIKAYKKKDMKLFLKLLAYTPKLLYKRMIE